MIFCSDIVGIIVLYVPRYKLQPWVEEQKLYIKWLCGNSKAVNLIEEKYKNQIMWERLSTNPSAINLIEQNISKVDWPSLSQNHNALHILQANINKIEWSFLITNKNGAELVLKNQPSTVFWSQLSRMKSDTMVKYLEEGFGSIDWIFLSSNPCAISLLKKNPEKINWEWLCLNENAGDLLNENENESNLDWDWISQNSGMRLDFLERNILKLNIPMLCMSQHIQSLIPSLLKQGRIQSIRDLDWKKLSANSHAIDLLAVHHDMIHYDALSANTGIFQDCVDERLRATLLTIETSTYSLTASSKVGYQGSK